MIAGIDIKKTINAAVLEKYVTLSMTLFDKDGKKLKDKDIKYLCDRWLTHVVGLTLFNNLITDKGLQYLKKPDFKKLQSLELERNNIQNVGCKQLSRINAPVLKSLRLGNNAIGDAGISHLGKRGWVNLEVLYLGWTKCQKQSIKAISRTLFPRLHSMTLSNQLTQPGMIALIMAQKLPNQLHFYCQFEDYKYYETTTQYKQKIESKLRKKFTKTVFWA